MKRQKRHAKNEPKSRSQKSDVQQIPVETPTNFLPTGKSGVALLLKKIDFYYRK